MAGQQITTAPEVRQALTAIDRHITSLTAAVSLQRVAGTDAPIHAT